MGRYSLENFERYRAVKLRPARRFTDERRLCFGTCRLHMLAWHQMEPRRGDFVLEGLAPAPEGARRAVLVLDDTPPDWARGMACAGFAALVRRVGKALDGSGLTAVLVRADQAGAFEREALLDAYADAFVATPLLLPLHAQAQIAYYRRRGTPFGVLVDARQPVLDLCEGFARLGLQRVWETSPVLIAHAQAAPDARALADQARRWHALAADAPLGLGWSLELRRLTYPQQLSAGGAMPLRFWWANTGSAALYDRLEVRLRLTGGGHQAQLHVQDALQNWLPGDIVHNQIIRLPEELPPGDYRLEVGMFDGRGLALPLNLDTPVRDGWYEVGLAVLDAISRPELYTIWNDYYPDGYYPLEDPKQPGEENQGEVGQQ